jgi:hypothetical protein
MLLDICSTNDSSMAKIINITQSYQSLKIDSYLAAAWHFALVALWPFEKIKKEKITRCQSFIKLYLQAFPETRTSFITYCEKILLFNRMQSVTDKIIDPPGIWFNPKFSDGYASTDELHRLIKKKRVVPSHHLQGISVLAKGYWDFINQPSPPVLLKMHDRLFNLRQYDLINLLSQVTLKHILVSKKLI